MDNVARVLIADDEPLARRRICALLAPHDDFLVVDECADGPSTLAALKTTGVDVLFLDIEMPELTGLELVRALGEPHPTVVFITAYERYAVDAFGVRALDYLLKPFDAERFNQTLARVRDELVKLRTLDAHARLPGLVRRGAASSVPDRLRLGDIEADVSARRVWRGGKQVVLRRKEFDVLVTFMVRAGGVVTRQELLEGVWGYQSGVMSRTIDTHVFELRRKLGHAAGEPGYIETVSRIGYRMTAAPEQPRAE